MPTILHIVTAEEPDVSGKMAPYVCRISDAGTITLPVVGEIKVEGKTLSEIESTVIDAYHPEYTVTRPSVFARILEYKTAKVSITGAVEKPGIYELRNDQMSLVALLMEAGGIIDEGATLIRIIHSGETAYGNMNRNAELNTAQIMLAGGFADENINSNTKLSVSDSRKNFTPDEALYREMVEGYKELLKTFGLEKSLEIRKKAESGKPKKVEPIVLPVKGLNIPFADVVLRDGDSVIVERLQLPLVTVVGLVNKPGNFPYPPDVKYNLMQALGFAGGLHLAAEPRYATIYRLRADGTTVSAAFNIVNVAKNADPTDALSVLLKPYDVVAVQHTPRTRAKVFWDRVFRMYITTYIRMEDIIQED